MYLLHTSTQLAALLKSLRKSKRLTQAALGAMLGVSAARISDIERDPGAVSIAQVLKLLHTLGARVHIDDGIAAEPSAPAAALPAGEW